MSNLPANPFSVPRLVFLSRLSSLLTASLAIIAILGWIIDNSLLKGMIGHNVAMSPSTALSFILVALSLGLLRQKEFSSFNYKSGIILAYLVGLTGLSGIAGYITSQNFSLDQLFIEEKLSISQLPLNTSLNFLFLALSLVLIDTKKRLLYWLGQYLNLLVFVTSLLALVGYSYSLSFLYQITAFIPMSLNTALAFLLLSFGLFCSRPTRGIAQIVGSFGIGGVLARKLIIAVIVIPFLLGYLILLGQQSELYSSDYGIPLMVSLSILIFIGLILLSANILNQVEAKRFEAEEKLEVQNYKLEALVAKNEAILSSIGDGVFAVDKDLNISLFNKSAQDLSGFKNSELLGKRFDKFLKFVQEENENENENFIQESMRRGKLKELTSQRFLIRKDGEKVPVAFSAAPLIDKKGQVSGCAVAFRNVSKERAVDQAKTEFVSLASHQLRSPLSSISWYSEMLLTGDAGKVNKEQRDYLEEIATANRRMTDLVDTLLDVSRLEFGTFMVEPKETSLKEVTRDVVDELKPSIISKKLNLEQSYQDHLPHVRADPKLTRIIIQNLLSNAVKYTPVGGGVKLEATFDQKEFLFSVIDTGLGIPKNQQPKIFTKLFRADNVRQKDSEGTGLGLYIVKSILDHVGGKVWFKSVENKGTTFFVSLPREGMKKKEGTKHLSQNPTS